jgi:hypothetical protein
MQAEEHYSNGNLQSAAESYKAAISFAKLHKFLNDESLVSSLDDVVETSWVVVCHH